MKIKTIIILGLLNPLGTAHLSAAAQDPLLLLLARARAEDENYLTVKMPSPEIRQIFLENNYLHFLENYPENILPALAFFFGIHFQDKIHLQRVAAILHRFPNTNVNFIIDDREYSGYLLETPLTAACEIGETEIVRTLLAMDAHPTIIDGLGNTPFWAVTHGCAGDIIPIDKRDQIRELLKQAAIRKNLIHDDKDNMELE